LTTEVYRPVVKRGAGERGQSHPPSWTTRATSWYSRGGYAARGAKGMESRQDRARLTTPTRRWRQLDEDGLMRTTRTTMAGRMTTSRRMTAATGRTGGVTGRPTPNACGRPSRNTPERSGRWNAKETTAPRLRRFGRQGTRRKGHGGRPNRRLPWPRGWTGQRPNCASRKRRSRERAWSSTLSTRKWRRGAPSSTKNTRGRRVVSLAAAASGGYPQ
jgi:hypothetical protein